VKIIIDNTRQYGLALTDVRAVYVDEGERMKNKWVSAKLSEIGSLKSFENLLTKDNIGHFVSIQEDGFDRKRTNGVHTFAGYVGDNKVAFIYNDFKVEGGAFGKHNIYRMQEFIEVMIRQKTPIVFLIDTMGANIFEGRNAIIAGSELIHSVKKAADNNLLITASTGRALGLGLLFLGMGDYRLTLKDKSLLNLTGPEVFKMFFGEKTDFGSYSSAERQLNKTEIVHEICETKAEMFEKIQNVLLIHQNSPIKNSIAETDPQSEQLKLFGGQHFEILSDMGQSVRTFISTSDDVTFGLFINPAGKANMVDVRSLRKYRNALNLFKKMGLPVVSVVDTAGGDPRVEQNDNNIAGEIINFTNDLIDYPYKKQGIVVGNLFGGASIFSFPPAFGGEKLLIVEGARIGIMHENLVRHLLQNSKRLLDQYEEYKSLEDDKFSDFTDEGVAHLIAYEQIGFVLDDFLKKCS
jgi:acetyl-CoA carboxylase carboxyl transferase subunit beta